MKKARKSKSAKYRLAVRILLMILVAELAGAVGAVFTAQSIGNWYSIINKPAFTPPDWIFAPTWVVLYALIGIAAGFVWSSKSKKKRFALQLYGVQLGLNILWSIIFFGMRNPAYAFAEIVVLWLAILLTMSEFYKVNKNAAWLLVPYIIWVSFAAILNFSIWAMNA